METLSLEIALALFVDTNSKADSFVDPLAETKNSETATGFVG